MPSESPDLRRDVVAEYRFDGNALDSSGGQFHGETHAITYCDDRFGKAHSAALFDGTDSFIVVTPPPPIDVATFSIAVWVRFHEMPNVVWSNSVVAQDDGTDENPEHRIFQLSCCWRHIVWHLMTDDRDPIYRKRVRLNEYYHIVVTCENGVHSLYVDGQFQDRIHRSVPETKTQPLHIGRKGTDEKFFYLNGAVDELCIFNRTLDAQDVFALFTENGFNKSLAPIQPAAADAANGAWGYSEVVFLDLQSNKAEYDSAVVPIAGRVMDGRPGRWANIEHGEFNRLSGLLTLNGMGNGPDGNSRAPFEIIGTLDTGELTVSYNFNGSAGNLVFARI